MGRGLDTPCGYNQIGAVVGATYPEEQKIIRELLPKSLLPLPGYGAQGATAKDIANAFNDDGLRCYRQLLPRHHVCMEENR